MTIAIGSDHAGFQSKQFVIEYLNSKGIQFVDFGCESDNSVDYPEYAHKVASAVERNELDFGILICGSGQGVNITANKHQAIRSALCWSKEIASLSRQHNNANVLALPGRFLTIEEIIEIIDVFLSTSFEGGRHQNRVNKISCQ